MLVWGYSQRSLSRAGTGLCTACGKGGTLREHVDYQHNHLWYAFGFASGIRGLQRCEQCGFERSLEAARARQLLPRWDRHGMAALGLGFLGLILFAVLLRVTGPEIRNIPDLTARVQRGDASALAHLRREAEAGDLPSQQALADLLTGSGPESIRDPVEALRWTRAAAERGSVRAELSLAARLEQGIGTAPDLPESMRWYRRAAEHGSPEGANSVGAFLLDGLAGTRDPAEAERWFRRGADTGDVPSAFNLGRCLLQRGATEEALRWLEAAATSERTDSSSVATSASAHYQLGLLYEEGVVVPRDIVQALEHYQAASVSNAEASAAVERLRAELSGASAVVR